MKFAQTVVSTAVVYAAVSGTIATAEPLSYRTESGLEFIPELRLDVEQNDNIARQSDAANPESVTTWGIAPKVTALLDRGTYRAKMVYQLDAGLASDDDNDYLDHRFQFINQFVLNHRNRLVVDYHFARLHQDRGVELTEGDALATALDKLIEYDRNIFRVKYTFGSQGAKGRIETGIDYRDRTYSNFRDNTVIATRYSDFRSPGAFGEFYLSLLPQTYGLVGVAYTDTHYQHDRAGVPSKDNQNLFFYTGASWDISGKTLGTIKIGHQTKDFDSAERKTFRGLSWKVGVEWQPQEQTRLDFATSQAAHNPDQDGDYVLRTRYTANVTHQWNDLFSSTGLIGYQQDDYTGAVRDGVLRDEDKWRLGIELDYQFRRWMTWTLGWRYEDKDSNWTGFSYQQNVFNAGVTLNL